MLVSFAVLMSWRVTGIVLHEWIGTALIAMIVVHLVVHWGWVESRVVAMGKPARRRFGGLLLNTAVFVAMGTTIISGLVVSKVAIPNHLSAASYLHWHGVHENAATITVLLLGLHLAYNWDRIIGAIRRALAPAVSRTRSARSWGISIPLAARRLVWVLLASAVLSGFVWSFVRLTPANDQVMFVHADGRRELAAPPPEVVLLRPGTEWPAVAAGAPRFVFSLVLLLVSATAGRRLLKLRRRRETMTAHAAEPART